MNLSLAALQLGLCGKRNQRFVSGNTSSSNSQREMNDENPQIEEDGYIKQKEISSWYLLICQEVLLEKMLPVTFCSDEFSLDSTNFLWKSPNLMCYILLWNMLIENTTYLSNHLMPLFPTYMFKDVLFLF